MSPPPPLSAAAPAIGPSAEPATELSVPARVGPRLTRVSAIIAAEAASLEAQFADIAGQLFARLEELGALVSASGELTAELDSPEVHAAVAALEAVPSAIQALGREGGVRAQVLRRLLQLVDHVSLRIDAAQTALRPVSIIAMNAKVEAARVGDESLHFTDFAEEIGVAFQQAKDSLGTVAEDMQALRARVQAASHREDELDARLEEAVAEAPARILASLQALAGRSAAAAAAAARVTDESQAVSAGVSDAVLSLQVGDCARQRLEHVSFALDLVAQAEAQGSLAALDEPSAVSPAEARALAGLCCELQAAQITDTSQELFRDVETTVTTLRRLAASAEQISEIGAGLFAADEGGGTFLAGLDRGIRQAQALFQQLDAAWRAADDIVASVLQTVGELEIRVAAVTAAEREVRRLALNAIVKSGRLGERGRALGVIAQQLEACVELTTEHTASVVSCLSELTLRTEELRQTGEQDARTRVAAAAGSTDDALDRLAHMAARVSGGLSRLAADSGAIARAVSRTGHADFHHRLVATAAASAAELRDLRGELGDAAPSPEIAAPVFARIARTYTMVREREIHAEILEPAGHSASAG